MKLYSQLLIAAIILLVAACQQSHKQYDNYSGLEKQSEQCMDDYLDDHDIEWKDIQPVFENYFASAEITNPDDDPAKQYMDILNYWANPSGRFPAFKEKDKILKALKKLDLNKKEVMANKQLTCFREIYEKNKASIDSTSAYASFGKTLTAVKNAPNISPGIVAGGLMANIEEKDLEKAVYRKAITMIFVFDMSIFLTSGS